MTSSQYDLTPRLSSCLDPHMLLQILIQLEEKAIYPKEEIRPVIAKLLDDQTQLYGLLTEYSGTSNDDRLRQVGDKVNGLTKELKILLEACQLGKGQEIRSCNSLVELEQHGVSRENVESLYELSHEYYKAGGYDQVIPCLVLYQDLLIKVLEPEVAKSAGISQKDDGAKLFRRSLNVKWGLLAAWIGKPDWSAAAAQVISIDKSLDDYLEKGHGMPKKEILRQRTWLIHWILFILFKSGNDDAHMQDRFQVLDVFMSEKYLALISLKCPWLLRYAAAAFIMHKKLKPMTKDVIHVLNQDKMTYADPMTEFLLALHQDMDFDLAKQKLAEATTLMNSDYFLWESKDAILSNARLAIFSIYCRIHQSVDISTIAEKMGMDVELTEDWIVELIQSGKLTGACIDSSQGDEKKSVFFPREEEEVYSQVLEKTKNMSFRLFMLQENAHSLVDKKSNQNITKISPTIAKHLIN